MSELFLRMERRGTQTAMADRFFTAPLKIAKAFDRAGYTEVMLMCASPGLLEGDRYQMRFELGIDTRTVLTTQSYQKLFRTPEGFSSQRVEIEVGERASLGYLPMPMIPFAGSRFFGQTEIVLRRTSRLFFCDGVQSGRVGEEFSFSGFSSRLRVAVDGRPVFFDHTRLIPGETEVGGIGFFEGYSCQALVYLYGIDPPSPPSTGDLIGACSQAREGYSVRLLARSADAIQRWAQAALNACF